MGGRRRAHIARCRRGGTFGSSSGPLWQGSSGFDGLCRRRSEDIERLDQVMPVGSAQDGAACCSNHETEHQVKKIECNLPDSLYESLMERTRSEKSSCDHVVSMALSQCFGKPLHTLFQVSTSAALVEGLYQGAVRVSRLLRHGDFGLGTFIDLDGEMVVLEGVCYRISSDGLVTKVEGGCLIPYAVVTRFSADFAKPSQHFEDFSELVSLCDALRSTDNLFYAFRVEGR